MKPRLSIIVPAYNEAARITRTLAAILAYGKRQDARYEVIVIDDGSRDATADMVHAMREQMPELKLIRNVANMGKGASVRTGMLIAKGEYRLFMDADNSTPIEEIEKLLPFMRDGFDIAIGSRRVSGANIEKKQPATREVLGHLFRFASRVLVPTDIVDTQNGFKLFTAASAQHLFGNLQTDGWAFDIEILLHARLGGYRVREVGIRWMNDGQSRMTLKGMVRMLADIFRLSLFKSSKSRSLVSPAPMIR